MLLISDDFCEHSRHFAFIAVASFTNFTRGQCRDRTWHLSSAIGAAGALVSVGQGRS